jgi:hypothetical protein
MGYGSACDVAENHSRTEDIISGEQKTKKMDVESYPSKYMLGRQMIIGGP